MKRKGWTSAALVGLLLLSAAALLPRQTQAAPEPSIVPRSWTLDFTHGKPQPLAVSDLDGTIQWYWYMTYKVVNRTGSDQLFIPDVTVADDTGRIITAGQKVPSRAFTLIKEREQNPLLVSPPEVIGRLLQGEDFARESVAIWPHDDTADPEELRLFITGLSGESQALTLPDSKEQILLRKTLMLRYSLPGNRPHPQQQPFIAHAEEWVMR